MSLKPWYKVLTPREDIREDRPLETTEFAVHLYHLQENRIPPDYQVSIWFFDLTFLKKIIQVPACFTGGNYYAKIETPNGLVNIVQFVLKADNRDFLRGYYEWSSVLFTQLSSGRWKNC